MQRSTSKDSLFSITSEASCFEVFNLGDLCKVNENTTGVVAFVGRTNFATGEWVGLILDRPEGKNNGSLGGIRYFECNEKYGLFCRPSKLIKIVSEKPILPTFLNASPARSVARSIASTTAATHKLRSVYAYKVGYDISDRVKIPGGKNGVVKFLDCINNELYAGVQLDRPLGSCDGTYNGVRYFKCNPLYGIFVAASCVTKCTGITKSAQIEVRHTKTSAIRTWKSSQESLNSAGLGSICLHILSPKLEKKVNTCSKSNAKNGEIVANLKSCILEKEAHLVQLTKELAELKERNFETQEFDNNVILMERFKEVVQYLNEEKEKYESINLLKDQLEKEVDDLTFKLDEYEMNYASLEAELKYLKMKKSEISEELSLATNKSSEILRITDQSPNFFPFLNDVKANYKDCYSQTFHCADDFITNTKPKLNIAKVSMSSQTDDYSTKPEQKQAYAQTSLISKVGMQFNELKKKVCELSVQTDFIENNTKSICDFGVQFNKPKKSVVNFAMQADVNVFFIEKRDFGVQFGDSVKCSLHFGMQTDGVEQKQAHAQTLISMFEVGMNFNELKKDLSDLSVQTEIIEKKLKVCLTESGIQTEEPKIIQFDFASQTDYFLTHVNSYVQTLNVALLSNKTQTDVECKKQVLCAAVQTDEFKKRHKELNYEISELDCINSKNKQIDVHNSEDLSTHGSVVDSKNKTLQELDVLTLFTTKPDRQHLQWEDKFKEKNEKVEQLDSTVSFLNSIISEQNSTIKKLRVELIEKTLCKSEAGFAINKDYNINNHAKLKKSRDYCDFCEIFDVHDTKDCPKELSRRFDQLNHSTTTSITSKIGARPFCNICEAFVHATNDCSEKSLQSNGERQSVSK